MTESDATALITLIDEIVAQTVFDGLQSHLEFFDVLLSSNNALCLVEKAYKHISNVSDEPAKVEALGRLFVAGFAIGLKCAGQGVSTMYRETE